MTTAIDGNFKGESAKFKSTKGLGPKPRSSSGKKHHSKSSEGDKQGGSSIKEASKSPSSMPSRLTRNAPFHTFYASSDNLPIANDSAEDSFAIGKSTIHSKSREGGKRGSSSSSSKQSSKSPSRKSSQHKLDALFDWIYTSSDGFGQTSGSPDDDIAKLQRKEYINLKSSKFAKNIAAADLCNAEKMCSASDLSMFSISSFDQISGPSEDDIDKSQRDKFSNSISPNSAGSSRQMRVDAMIALFHAQENEKKMQDAIVDEIVKEALIYAEKSK